MNVQFMYRISQQKMQVAFKGATNESLEELKKQREEFDKEIN